MTLGIEDKTTFLPKFVPQGGPYHIHMPRIILQIVTTKKLPTTAGIIAVGDLIEFTRQIRPYPKTSSHRLGVARVILTFVVRLAATGR